MEHAKKLLIDTNDTIAAIGDAVGYADQKYFSQLFKKIVGESRLYIGDYTHRKGQEQMKGIKNAGFILLSLNLFAAIFFCLLHGQNQFFFIIFRYHVSYSGMADY